MNHNCILTTHGVRGFGGAYCDFCTAMFDDFDVVGAFEGFEFNWVVKLGVVSECIGKHGANVFGCIFGVGTDATVPIFFVDKLYPKHV